MDHMISLKTGNKRIQYQMFAASASANNNFNYRDHYRYNSPIIENKHNDFKSLGILQNIYLNLSKGQYLEAGLWYQSKSLEIPALMGSYAKSYAHQKDSVFRSFVSYRKTGYKYALVIRSAYFSDFINYTDKIHADSGYSLNSKIAASRLMNEVDYRLFLTSKLIAGGGISYNRLMGNSGNFGGSISENEYAIYGSLKLVHRNLIINAGLRKEFYKGLNPDPQLSAGVRYKIRKGIIIRSSVSSKFRKPTFNEKYWKPGGNPDLRPEKGRGGELTLEWQSEKIQRSIWVDSRITGYFQSIDNWIQWILKDSLTPVEYKKVHAKGLEVWLGYGLNRPDIKVEGHVNYNFNRSSIIRTFDNNVQYQGNQLVYIPQHTFRASADVAYKSFIIGFYASYTGLRETVETADLYLQLPPYTTFDTYLEFRKDISDFPLILNFRVDNIFDKSYEVIRSFPVPGRTFHFTLTLALNHTLSKNQ
jgi:outer membrane cobalamin receptor